MSLGLPNAVLAGGGQLGERMRAVDWSRTPLGPVETWPQSLRTCVRIILTSQQPMFVWWGEQLINLYNDAYVSILGGKHPDALGQPASEVWREIWDDVGPRAAKAIRENEGTFDEALLLIMERNGYREETYYTFSYSPVPGDSGGPGGIICANSSDTQRIFGERQQALLREVAARASNARTVESACTLALDAFAVDRKDLPFALLYTVQDDVATLVSTSGIEQAHPLCVARIARETACPLPVRAVLDGAAIATGSLIGVADVPRGDWPEPPAEAIAVPVRVGDQPAGAVLVVGRNPFRLLDGDYRRFLDLIGVQLGNAITNARTFEEERRRAEALAELDRAKTTFFSNISHEFRTPLTLMLGPTEDALHSAEGALIGDSLRAVHRNELRLLKLVNALLDFSRIEAGRIQANYEATDLAQLTRELASAFRSAMERAGLRFEVQCEPLPGPVHVDRGMWEKIVLNLLSNALKFTFEGGVTVALRERDGHIELVVRDTGTGIPAEELPRLFERFHRVEGARSRTHEGSGIGLALAAELVKLHGGVIDATSRVGEGTTFTIRIPYVAARGEIARADVAPSTSVNAFVEEAGRWLGDDDARTETVTVAPSSEVRIAVPHETIDSHILVADDNSDMRDYLRRLLGERWKVTVVSDGAKALEAARATRPDLILTDVMMPKLDGFGLLRALREDASLSTIPVVMLSARAGEEARVEGIEAGADDYLIKPFSARELIARASNMLQLSRLRRDVELERNRLASFVQQTPVGVVLWEGPELRCGVVNAAYQRMIDRPIAPGMPILEIFPELAGTAALERVQRVYRESASFNMTENRFEFVLPDGSRREGFFNSTMRPLHDAHGATIGVIVVTLDVTEQVYARQAVEKSRTEAILANRAKDEFLAMLGHELRNPLAPILTALELMRLRSNDSVARERTIIERQTHHLAALVDDLLDVSRIARGMVELKRERVNIAETIAKALETAAPLLEQQRHELITDVPHDLYVDADPSRLTQVFANLVTNAAKYTDRGGRITITGERTADEVVIHVRDTGRGIAADMLPRVFDLFVQERQNLDRSRGGLGLGLAIVKNLVVLHGGKVAVESAGPGQGSVFSVALAPSMAPAGTLAIADERAAPHTATGRVSVLVVDDNVDAACLLGDLLEAQGYRIHIAHDAPEALKMADTMVPDVALLDIGLPAMDGYELARRLRTMPTWRNVKMLAITGYGQSLDRQRSADAGFDQHLVKPIDLKTLQSHMPPP